MRLILIIVGLVVFIVLVRRPYFRYARFTIPATVGALAGWAVGCYIAAQLGPSYPYSPYLPYFVAFVIGIGAGEGAKNWLDRVFEKKQ